MDEQLIWTEVEGYFNAIRGEDYAKAASYLSQNDIRKTKSGIFAAASRTEKRKLQDFLKALYGKEYSGAKYIETMSGVTISAEILRFEYERFNNLKGVLSTIKTRKIGIIKSGINQGFVVYEIQIENPSGQIATIEVMPCEFIDGKWGLGLKAEIVNLVKRLSE